MLKGTCKKCGEVYYGWALTEEKHRKCGRCGGELVVKKIGGNEK